MKKFTQTANAFVRGANLTHDPTLVALVASATRLPWPLFAISAGVIIDRRDRKRMMVQADVFSLVLTCGVIGLICRDRRCPRKVPPAHMSLLYPAWPFYWVRRG